MHLNPASLNPGEPAPQENPGASTGANVMRALALAAAVLLAAGTAAALLHARTELAAGLRWTGFALFVPFAVRRRSLLLWTFLAMLAGAELGVDAPRLAAQSRFLADIFLRLIRMIVAPLIFGGLVTGIAGHGELRGVGRVALKALAFFEGVTTLGLILGAIAINVSQAGVGVALPAALGTAGPAQAAQAEGWQQMLLNVFPENIAQAVAQNQVLQVAVFALLFGTALAMLPAARRAPLVAVLQSLTDVMFRLTRIVMVMAPVAAGAALAFTVGSMGPATLLPLAKLVATYYAALAAFVLLVLVPIVLLARIPLRRFSAAVAEPAAIGFATTTSEAALPLAMERMEEFGVPRWIVSFVIPTGYSFNMTGSSLYLSMAALFAAQAAGMHLTAGQQIVMLATLMLTSKGVAGVPRAVLVILLGTAGSFHIPAVAVMMLLGVDTLMDMGRTAMNVIGNCLASAVVARWEGEPKAAATSS
ncbi:MAG: cation:dicarboxylase symporter family transporter [Terracidiphilus sp.]